MTDYHRARDAWLNEILSKELQHLPQGFLEDLRVAISSIEEKIADSEGKEPLRSLLVGERRQLQTIHDQILELRGAKLLSAASLGRSVRTTDSTEKELYDEARRLVGSYKERFYRISEEGGSDVSRVETGSEPVTIDPTDAGAEVAPEEEGEPGKAPHVSARQNRILRILREFPCFVGPDLKSYGPFSKEDIVALSDEVAGILLARNVAERVRPAGERT